MQHLSIKISKDNCAHLFNGSIIIFEFILSCLTRYYNFFLIFQFESRKSTDSIEKLTEEDKLSEYLSFGGYAISQSLKVAKNIKCVDKKQVRVLVYKALRCLKHEISTQYTESTTSHFQISNRGGKVIPNDTVKEWGMEILSVIRTASNIQKHGNDTILVIKNAVSNNKELQTLFNTMWNKTFSSKTDYDHIINDKNLKQEVQRELSNKIVHSRSQVYIRHYKNVNFSRCYIDSTRDQSTRREHIKIIPGRGRKKTKLDSLD